jgi:hypothetical protein
MEYHRRGPHQGFWRLKPNWVVPTKPEMLKMVGPEQIVLSESMQVGQRHLQDAGYSGTQDTWWGRRRLAFIHRATTSTMDHNEEFYLRHSSKGHATTSWRGRSNWPWRSIQFYKGIDEGHIRKGWRGLRAETRSVCFLTLLTKPLG